MSNTSVAPYLAAPAATLAVLKKYGLHTQKKFGQNFLIDAHVPEKIVESARVCKDDMILEIGPGIGTLTQFLAQRAGYVLALEIDERLIPVLSETLSQYDNAEVICADALKADLGALISERANGRSVKVAANLPYYITTPILMTMLEAHLPAESYTLMVQKEVADRMMAGPGSKDYGALSLAVQYYTEPVVVTNVPPTCFIPAPKVGSTVIQLKSKAAAPREEERGSSDMRPHRQDARLDTDMERLLFRLIRAAFNQRRKTLVNALKNSSELPYTGEQISGALDSLGLRSDIRGEALSLEDFIDLAAVLSGGSPAAGADS